MVIWMSIEKTLGVPYQEEHFLLSTALRLLQGEKTLINQTPTCSFQESCEAAERDGNVETNRQSGILSDGVHEHDEGNSRCRCPRAESYSSASLATVPPRQQTDWSGKPLIGFMPRANAHPESDHPPFHKQTKEQERSHLESSRLLSPLLSTIVAQTRR